MTVAQLIIHIVHGVVLMGICGFVAFFVGWMLQIFHEERDDAAPWSVYRCFMSTIMVHMAGLGIFFVVLAFLAGKRLADDIGVFLGW